MAPEEFDFPLDIQISYELLSSSDDELPDEIHHQESSQDCCTLKDIIIPYDSKLNEVI